MSHESLTILAITDSHGVVSDWDYVSDAPYSSPRGLDRLARLVREVRASSPNVLLFDVGDSIQGTPLVSLAAQDSHAQHPMATVLTRLGVDAACIGNHELDYGLDVLANYAAQCDFPLLAANYDGLPGVGRSTVIDVPTQTLGVVRVGVLGVSTPGSLVWNAPQLAGQVSAEGIVECAAAEVPRLHAAGADLVVVLSHSGLGPSSTYGSTLPWPENDTLRLMREVPGIDAVALGHAHVDLAGHERCEVSGVQVPYVEPSALAMRLGRIDLTLARENGVVRVVQSASRSIPVTTDPDPAVTEIMRELHDRTQASMSTLVATAAEPITATPVANGPSPAVDLINHAQAAHVEAQLRGTDLAHLPVLSVTAMGAPHDGLQRGPITTRELHRIYRFDNRVYAVAMRTGELIDYLEHNARYFGPDDVPDYNLDSLGSASHVVSYRIDAGTSPGARVGDVLIDGAPLAPADRFVVALSDYRASGGGGFPATAGNPAIYTGPLVRDVVASWMARNGPVTESAINRAHWSVRDDSGVRDT